MDSSDNAGSEYAWGQFVRYVNLQRGELSAARKSDPIRSAAMVEAVEESHRAAAAEILRSRGIR